MLHCLENLLLPTIARWSIFFTALLLLQLFAKTCRLERSCFLISSLIFEVRQMTYLLAKIWRTMRGKWQWYVLWLFHHKFIVGVSGVIFNDQGQILLLRHLY